MSLTLEQIEQKDYTYVSIVLKGEKEGDNDRFDAFLVPSPYKAEAIELAKQYAEEHGLSLRSWDSKSSGSCKCCGCFLLYPRNYVAKSRKLFQEGKYL